MDNACFLSFKKEDSMAKGNLLSRISVDKNILTGKPIIKGSRLSVEFILNLLANGQSAEEIVKEYHGITIDDIHACLYFAARSLEDTTFMPLPAKAA
jgi:uncharacterized protein (DUF433 family)